MKNVLVQQLQSEIEKQQYSAKTSTIRDIQQTNNSFAFFLTIQGDGEKSLAAEHISAKIEVT